MNDDQIQKIQDELMKNLDREKDLDFLIEDLSAKIAVSLIYKNSPITVEFQNENLETRVLTFNARQTMSNQCKPIIILTVADDEHYKNNPKYRPFIVTSEINHNYTSYESMKLTVDRFLRHYSGHPIVEEIEE